MANSVIAKGDATITINPQETEAKLIFTPDPDGLGWDVDAVNKLAAENNLTPPLNPKDLEAFLSKAGRAKTKDPHEMLIYQGLLPEEAVPEAIAWEALPVPADMAVFQKETLDAASLPELFRVKVERIKKEKIVKKPGALPFMPVKEETVVTYDKKETREEVMVDPVVKEIKYADKGKKLGTVTPPKPGKPGKSVFGRPLQPQPLPEGGFLLGAGIGREKNDLVAQASGFVRIGENWADMLALAKPSWEIRTGADGLTLFFTFHPGDPRFAPPKAEDILAEAKAKGAAEESLVSSDSLDGEIQEALKTNIPLEAFPLLQAWEATARVDINPDNTKAALYLRKGTGGYQPLEMKAISQVLKDSKVQVAEPEKLKEAINSFLQSKALELKDYVLAQGKPSTRGKDKELELSVPLLPENQAKVIRERLKGWWDEIRAGEDGLLPDEITGFALVEKGAVVGKVSASSDGEAGQDIFGKVIPGLPGNDPDLKLFRGLELHGSTITAGKPGLLLIKAEDRNFRAKLVDYQDAKVAVHISSDAMEARADLIPEAGAGIDLSPENVLKVLNAIGVKKGIDKDTVEKACAVAKAKGSVAGVIVATGVLPVAKGGSAVKWLVPVSPPQLAGEDGTGEAPGKTVQVKANTPIAELSEPAAEGKSGFDVKGNEIPSDKGAAFVLEHDDSITEEACGPGKRLVAAKPGELSFDGKVLEIASHKEINGDVGPATGSINFPGEVKISGKVLPGFAVIGGLSVFVGGVAEGALISSGGKATIAQGIKGGSKGVVRAHTAIEAAFSEKATLMSVGDIDLKNGSIISFIKTNGKLTIAAEKGKLIGGVCQARNGIDAANVGSETGGRTEISFGQDYLIKDQIEATEEQINKAKSDIAKVDVKIKVSIKNPESLERVRVVKVKLIKNLEQLNLKLFTLREKFEEHHESELRVRGTIYPGVVIESHGRYYEIKQSRSNVVFYFARDAGRIMEKALI
ncbi:FapA family protein [Leadbettera azotonutricia]|uniref:Flagellar Assembly Protein A N-terminal region domain-containing protein n=1 Tax=Leadbettera azotonutricia (strain ATCC BAA-888 / DSM 13862 / ZAS-9) TaxID=545695 RepID=F5YDP4_LEAAZ|nr:FapA family protein [Leadbettera azotonutricia]AEF81366.1 conserved hypothetical protein [Leadbettera azotonutricia ZAS-9]